MGGMWTESQRWEQEWHGNCANSLGEEIKQVSYAERMGIRFANDGKTPYTIPCRGCSIVDIGGGPYSLLLKCVNAGHLVVVDPLEFPLWVYERYKVAGIEVLSVKGEDVCLSGFDEAWIYNVLQHTEDPRSIIDNARAAAKTVRIFEWIDTAPTPGHPQTLTQTSLDKWLGGKGIVERMNDPSRRLYGACYYGVFEGGRR